MRLTGAVTHGSGAINEDGWGCFGAADDVSAAWIFDGVTGINTRNHLPGGSDAAWLVAKAQTHLLEIAGANLPLADILATLVHRLIADWAAVAPGLDLPADYDPPAACLILAKRYGASWQALRLGDSCLLSRSGETHTVLAASPNNAFDQWLSSEARKRRDEGVLDIKALMAGFRPQLKAARALRNKPGGYSILEADTAALAYAEFLDLGRPSQLLLCTDGYYRAVDHYGLHTDQSLLDSPVDEVLAALRAAEAADPDCRKHPRFKPADDATAVKLEI